MSGQGNNDEQSYAWNWDSGFSQNCTIILEDRKKGDLQHSESNYSKIALYRRLTYISAYNSIG